MTSTTVREPRPEVRQARGPDAGAGVRPVCNALPSLWPDAGDFPVDGEIDIDGSARAPLGRVDAAASGPLAGEGPGGRGVGRADHCLADSATTAAGARPAS